MTGRTGTNNKTGRASSMSRPRFTSTKSATGRKGGNSSSGFQKPTAVGSRDGPKRTPIHIGDGYGNHPSYEVEQVLASQTIEGKERFKVKWVGIPNSFSTWEPTEHFLGDAAEAKLAAFVAMRDKKRKVNVSLTPLCVMPFNFRPERLARDTSTMPPAVSLPWPCILA